MNEIVRPANSKNKINGIDNAEPMTDSMLRKLGLGGKENRAKRDQLLADAAKWRSAAKAAQAGTVTGNVSAEQEKSDVPDNVLHE